MEKKILLPVVEIFSSLQGEGANTGKPVLFIRLGGCNLACPWCDTDFMHFTRMSLDQIIEEGERLAPSPRAAIITGGEPFIHPSLVQLLERLKALGYWIGVETNGVQAPPAGTLSLIDYISVSPKVIYRALYLPGKMLDRADEVRIVVDGEAAPFCREMRERIRARFYFLSPCEKGGAFNIAETVSLLGQLNMDHPRDPWLLSIQTHKWAGFR